MLCKYRSQWSPFTAGTLHTYIIHMKRQISILYATQRMNTEETFNISLFKSWNLKCSGCQYIPGIFLHSRKSPGAPKFQVCDFPPPSPSVQSTQSVQDSGGVALSRPVWGGWLWLGESLIAAWLLVVTTLTLTEWRPLDTAHSAHWALSMGRDWPVQRCDCIWKSWKFEFWLFIKNQLSVCLVKNQYYYCCLIFCYPSNHT